MQLRRRGGAAVASRCAEFFDAVADHGLSRDRPAGSPTRAIVRDSRTLILLAGNAGGGSIRDAA